MPSVWEVEMKNIIVSNVTYQMLMRAAINPFKRDGRQTPSGMWIIPVEDETFENLQGRHYEMGNKTLDDTIQCILMEVASAAKN